MAQSKGGPVLCRGPVVWSKLPLGIQISEKHILFVPCPLCLRLRIQRVVSLHAEMAGGERQRLSQKTTRVRRHAATQHWTMFQCRANWGDNDPEHAHHWTSITLSSVSCNVSWHFQSHLELNLYPAANAFTDDGAPFRFKFDQILYLHVDLLRLLRICLRIFFLCRNNHGVFFSSVVFVVFFYFEKIIAIWTVCGEWKLIT